MITSTDRPMRDSFSALLRYELELTPTRWRTIARITLGTTIVVALSMTFQIPLPAYIAYIVFLVSHEDAASTLVSSLGGLVAATLAVALSLLFYVFDASEPALRIPLLALSTFAGTFLARTSKLGPIAFLAGYILVLSQTLIDDTPAMDPLVHGLLWLWVVIALPVGVTVLVNLLFGESPVALSRQRATPLLGRLASYIENPFSENPQRLRDDLLALDQLKNKAFLWDKRLKIYAEEDARLVALLLEIHSIARSLPRTVPPNVRHTFGAAIKDAGAYLLQRRNGVPVDLLLTQARAVDVGSDEPACVALQLAIQELLDRVRGVKAVDSPAPKAAAHAFLIPSSLQNRSHAGFAIKVMLAVLASYATYTLLDWPGIRTAVTTCFFVTLTTFGEGIHKFTLRASGAIIGGLMAGLCLVFVLPSLTDIGQLCLVIAVATAFCAWISTSSEAIAYAGMQIAFAFFLGVLQGYGPASDLTVLRDRIVGILIGNVWVTAVFASLWPVSAREQARSLRAGVLKKLGRLLGTPSAASSLDKTSVTQDLAHAALLQDRGAFEWRPLAKFKATTPTPHSAEAIASLTLMLLRVRDANGNHAALSALDSAVGGQLIALSDNTLPPPVSVAPELTNSTALRQAHQQLEKEIEHASRAI